MCKISSLIFQRGFKCSNYLIKHTNFDNYHEISMQQDLNYNCNPSTKKIAILFTFCVKIFSKVPEEWLILKYLTMKQHFIDFCAAVNCKLFRNQWIQCIRAVCIFLKVAGIIIIHLLIFNNLCWCTIAKYHLEYVHNLTPFILVCIIFVL